MRWGSPSYTLGTAGVVEHDGLVLLVQTAYRRNWSLPGGLLDRGEEPLDGLRREVREEAGVEIDVHGEPVVIVDTARQLVEFYYRATLASGVRPDDAHAGSSEIERVGWFPMDEARRLVRGPTRYDEKLAVVEDAPSRGVVVLPKRRRGR